MPHRHVAFGDRDEARQARLGRQEIVEGRVEATRSVGVGQAIADGEEAPARVVEHAEIGAVRQVRASVRRRARIRLASGAAGTSSRSAGSKLSVITIAAATKLPLSTVDT